jgi:signal peptidase II
MLALIVGIIVYLIWVGHFFESELVRAGLGSAIGGASSNMFDRFWRRGVVDFIDLGFWPAFNFADVAIVLGVALGLWNTLSLFLGGR